MLEDRFMELLQDLYDFRYNLRSAFDYHVYMSDCSARSNDIVGVSYHDGMATAYESVVPALSALLDKAESGR